MSKYEIEKCKAHYEGNSYNEQNVLVVQHNFPTCFYGSDELHSVYNDRIPNDAEMQKRSKDNPAQWGDWKRVKPKDGKIFLQKMFNTDRIDGYRIVRYTNVSNGYPLWRIDAIKFDESIKNRKLCNGLENTINNRSAEFWGDYYYEE